MIAVIFGGKSCEHDVSIVTGVMALKSLGRSARAIYMDKDGVMWCGDKLSELSSYENFSGRGLKRVHFMPSSDGVYTDGGKKLFRAEAALICCHGAYGEDGCLQGLLEISGIPYTGSGVLASSVGMDKLTMKRLFTSCGLPCVNYIGVKKEQFESGSYDFVAELKSDFKFPLIVKPSNLGSSIGIGMAHDFEQLFDRMRVAFEFDNSVIIEQALENFTEINCAVIGDGSKRTTSLTEQPLGWTEFLTYEDKYLGKGKGGDNRRIPAPLETHVENKIKELALAAFDAVGASGVARVDFMIGGGEIFVNEINTVPGSLAYYLFEGTYTMKTLIEELIEIAKRRHERKQGLIHTYKAVRHGK